jgi:hypothetical protein
MRLRPVAAYSLKVGCGFCIYVICIHEYESLIVVAKMTRRCRQEEVVIGTYASARIVVLTFAHKSYIALIFRDIVICK